MQKHRELGARMYFVRIELSHLFEGLKVVEEIRKSPELMALLSHCDAKTQDAFHSLERVLPRGKKRKKLEKLIGKLRHNLAFHYDESGRLIKKAIADRASRIQAQYSSPILANVYLHYALALWFEKVVKKRCKGEACLIRYANGVRHLTGRQMPFTERRGSEEKTSGSTAHLQAHA
jgi:hypothetical protein